MTKAELRKTYLEKRRAMSADEVGSCSRVIADRVFAVFDFAKLKAVHCYIPIPKFNEIDTSFIFERIWKEFTHVLTAVPRVDEATGELEHLYYTRETNMVENAWGISEPAGAERANPKDLDLVLVPLLCFDERGYRVGYGKGFYDRFLRECRADCVKAGLSLFPPVIEIRDTHVGDVPLDLFVMPNGVFRPE
jgi:5-formyltetrahydrofolate cyclo-ligase